MKLTQSPSFCFIAPTNYLHLTTKSSTHLTLAHLIIENNDKYNSFYKQRSDAGDIIICDNSAFELSESFDPNRLIEAALSVGAHALVLPDYPDQPSSKTIEAAIKWIPEFKKAGLKTFFVPQSKVGDTEDWLNAYKWGAANPDIDILGMSILAIPNAIPQVPRHMSRVAMALLLKQMGLFDNTKHHHWLGLNSPEEVEGLLSLGVVDTLDSSSPVQYGLLGHMYDTRKDGWGVPRKQFIHHVDFNSPYFKETETAIQHNVNVIADIFSKYQ